MQILSQRRLVLRSYVDASQRTATGHRLSKSETPAGVSGSFSPSGRRNAVSAPPYPCRRTAKADDTGRSLHSSSATTLSLRDRPAHVLTSILNQWFVRVESVRLLYRQNRGHGRVWSFMRCVKSLL